MNGVSVRTPRTWVEVFTICDEKLAQYLAYQQRTRVRKVSLSSLAEVVGRGVYRIDMGPDTTDIKYGYCSETRIKHLGEDR